MKYLALVILLIIAVAQTKDDTKNPVSISVCSAEYCLPEFNKTINQYSDIEKMQLVQEQTNYQRCMVGSQKDKSSPCYGFNWADNTTQYSAEEFANCQNVCGEILVNYASVQQLACTCQVCAMGAACSSQVLVYISSLVILVALIL